MRVCCFLLILAGVAVAQPESRTQSSKQAIQQLRVAVRLLNAGHIDEGIERLQAFLESHPEDPKAEKARALLPEFGVGEEVRVILEERKVFRKRLKMTDRYVLGLAENALKQLRDEYYEGITPVFDDTSLEVLFYDSQVRYRKASGLITTGGHFTIKESNVDEGSLLGAVVWYLPPYARTNKDRLLKMQSTLYHEIAHYLNAVHFAGTVPGPLEEGIAMFLESRLNTEYYQYYRQTDRQNIERKARNGLGSFVKYDDFFNMVGGARGLGRGDATIGRWYGFCYSLVDFFERGELNSRKSSFRQLLEFFSKLCEDELEALEERKKEGVALLPHRRAKALLEEIVREFYGSDLQSFHKALVGHITREYRQY